MKSRYVLPVAAVLSAVILSSCGGGGGGPGPATGGGTPGTGEGAGSGLPPRLRSPPGTPGPATRWSWWTGAAGRDTG